MLHPQLLKKMLGILRRVCITFFLCVVLAPLFLGVVACLGWPPVVGNLVAAHTMGEYAQQAYPGYRQESIWADYNLVDGRYWLTLSNGEDEVSLGYCWKDQLISDPRKG